MICPFCLHKKTEIYNTRSTNDGQTVWRRRRCLQCHKAFTSEEAFRADRVWKVNNINKLSNYSRGRLALSILKSCDHRKDDDRIWYMVEAVERKLLTIAAKNNGTLNVGDIIDSVSGILKNFDAAAYVKYLSYHQNPRDLKTLRQQLRKTSLS